MDDEDLILIESHLDSLAIAVGALEITEDRFYRTRESADAQERLMFPRERTIAKIQALERFLSLYDRTIYNQAMAKIHDVLRRRSPVLVDTVNLPDYAAVIVSQRMSSGDTDIDMRNLPDLSQIRARLRDLAGRLREL